jgi:hypothetical protein
MNIPEPAEESSARDPVACVVGLMGVHPAIALSLVSSPRERIHVSLDNKGASYPACAKSGGLIREASQSTQIVLSHLLLETDIK